MSDDLNIIAKIESLCARNAFHEAEQKCRDLMKTSELPAELGTLYGLILEKLGRTSDAINNVRNATHQNPHYTEAFFQLGRLLIQSDQQDIADGDLREPIPLHFDWGRLNYQNTATFPSSKLPEGIACLRQSLQLDPTRMDALILLGLTLFDQPAHRPEAVEAIQKAASLAPDKPECVFGLGRIALWQGQCKTALDAFISVMKAAPGFPFIDAYIALANTGVHPVNPNVEPLLDQSVEGHCEIAAALADALSNPAVDAHAKGIFANVAPWYAQELSQFAIKYATAKGAYVASARLLNAALKLDPTSHHTSLAFGHLMFVSNALDLAETGFEKALERDPGNADAIEMLTAIRFGKSGKMEYAGLFGPNTQPNYSGLDVNILLEDVINLGEAKRQTLDFEHAIHFYEKGVRLYPDNAEVHLCYSETLAHMGEFQTALPHAEKAVELDPQNGWARTHLGALYRCVGELSNSWEMQEGRLSVERPNSRDNMPALERWNGQPLNGGKLLIWREEGFGDEMRYAGCLRDAIQEVGSENIVFECSPRLESLFIRSFPDVDIRLEDLKTADHSDMKYHLPLLSLPGRYRNELSDCPTSGKYLVADEQRVEKWRKRLAQIDGKPKSGISWRSFNLSWRKRTQSCTIDDLAPVIAQNNVTFINLQGDDCADDLAWAQEHYGCTIHTFDDLDIKNDAEEMAALLSALDVVVSSRTWVMTFAGSVGTPTLVFSGPYNSAMMNMAYDPWAPEVEVFYHRFGEDWSGPMAAIADALSKYG